VIGPPDECVAQPQLRGRHDPPPARSCPTGLRDDVIAAMRNVQRETGKGFGDPANPLLVSVRSGAKFRREHLPWRSFGRLLG
jgi:hypothetical protein